MGDAIVTWTQEQKELIKKTVAQDATDAELAMFLHIAAKAGLDPLQRQVHFTKRNGRVTVIAGIDGLQARAAREQDFEGILSGVVHAKDDFEFDATAGKVTKHTYNAFGDRGPIKGAWSTVQRRGKLPFTAIVRFEEFNQGSSPTWKQMPSVMIQKVAKSSALRMAYPEQFSSIYEGAEMEQAGVSVGEKDVTPTTAPRGGDAVRAALGQPLKAEPPAPPATTVIEVPDYSGMAEDKLVMAAMEVESWIEKHPTSKKLNEAKARLAAMQLEILSRRDRQEPPPVDEAQPTWAHDPVTGEVAP